MAVATPSQIVVVVLTKVVGAVGASFVATAVVADSADPQPSGERALTV